MSLGNWRRPQPPEHPGEIVVETWLPASPARGQHETAVCIVMDDTVTWLTTDEPQRAEPGDYWRPGNGEHVMLMAADRQWENWRGHKPTVGEGP